MTDAALTDFEVLQLEDSPDDPGDLRTEIYRPLRSPPDAAESS